MEKQISEEKFNALCKNCGERHSCKGICVELNNLIAKEASENVRI